MTSSDLPFQTELSGLAAHVLAKLADMLLTPSATLSVASLLTALVITAFWLRGTRGRTSLRVMRRALLSRRWLFGPSARIDWFYAFFNVALIGLLFGWAVVSATTIAQAISGGLGAAFGALPQPLLTGWAAMAATTFILYLAFEAAYFIEHWLAHRVEWLWHFHRVHHLAETLGPATFHRVHPVDTIIFYNFIALFTGVGTGLCAWLFGRADILTMWGENALLALAAYLIIPLQHSQIWIPATGWLGRIILSPAHHQLHHSDDPRHHHTNFGNSLALFDWLAGTLCVPDKKRPKLLFGAGTYPVNPHGLNGAFLYPFVEAWRSFFPRKPRAAQAEPTRQPTS